MWIFSNAKRVGQPGFIESQEILYFYPLIIIKYFFLISKIYTDLTLRVCTNKWQDFRMCFCAVNVRFSNGNGKIVFMLKSALELL